MRRSRGLPGRVERELACPGLLQGSGRQTYPLDSFGVSQEGLHITTSLVRAPNRGCNILLYGPEGTGKTEFARALAASCGRQAYFVQYGEDGDVTDRRRALTAAASSIPGDTGLLIVDEADNFLNTEQVFLARHGTMEKSWLNHYLDQSRAKIVWITNKIHRTEKSVRRRFDYSGHFRALARWQRLNIWTEHLKDHPLSPHLSPETVQDLATRYKVSAGAIGSALEALKDIFPEPPTSPEQLVAPLESLLRRHRDLIGRGG